MEIKVIITLTAIMLFIIAVTPRNTDDTVTQGIEIEYDTIGVYKYIRCKKSNEELRREIEDTKRELSAQIADQSNIIDTLQFRNYGAK